MYIKEVYKNGKDSEKVSSNGKRKNPVEEERKAKQILLKVGYDTLSTNTSILGSEIELPTLGKVIIESATNRSSRYSFVVKTEKDVAYGVEAVSVGKALGLKRRPFNPQELDLL